MSRPVEAKSQAVHALLEQYGHELPWKSEDGHDAKTYLAAQGYTDRKRARPETRITENDYNVKRHNWKKARGLTNSHNKSVTRAQPNDLQVVAAEINKVGGIDAYKQRIAMRQEKLNQLQSKVEAETTAIEQMNANAAAYENVSKLFAKAS